MSGIDANPFADPYENPFADPAVTSATGPTARPGLGDYNPFASQPARAPEPKTRVEPSYTKTFDSPATIQSTPEPPPPYTPAAAQKSNINTAELQKRQEELERKAAELQAREDAIKNASNFNPRMNNWPPLPSFCCVKPCFYQDISLEIPTEFQKVVRTLYYTWLFYACVLCLNVLGTTALLIQFGEGVTFGFSLLALVLFLPLSFLCWFRTIYKAFKNDSSFFFMVFFFMFFFQAIVCGIYAIGIVNVGSCGYIIGLSKISKPQGTGDKVVGGITLFIAVLWTISTLLSVLMLFKVHRIYRMTGNSINKAQAEFTAGILTNEHVQTAASNAAAGAARGAVQQTLSGGNQQNRLY